LLKALIALSIYTLVHSWYPPACCSENDCKPVPCAEIGYKDFQYSYMGKASPWTGESIDKNCHACITPEGTLRCLFIYYKGADV
jgi:hypothetical protein